MWWEEWCLLPSRCGNVQGGGQRPFHHGRGASKCKLTCVWCVASFLDSPHNKKGEPWVCGERLGTLKLLFSLISHRSGRALRNPAYSAEGFVGPPTSYTEPAIYKEVEVSSSFCSEDEPEKPVQNPLYLDVTKTTTVPQMPSHINQKNSQPLVAVHRKPVGKNLHNKEGLARCQPGMHQGKYPTNSTPVQGYAKLNAMTRYTSLEGGKTTKNIATPLGVSHDYSRLEH